MKKLGSIVLAAFLLGACSNDDNAIKKEEEEFEELLEITTDEEYVETLKEEEVILDAEYSIMDNMGIAKLRVTVDEKVTTEKAKELAIEQEAKVSEEYPNLIPVVTIVQNDVELYSTLNEDGEETIDAEATNSAEEKSPKVEKHEQQEGK